MFINPIKKLQKGQNKALAVFQKAKTQQQDVLKGIDLEATKVAKKILKEQEKQQELIQMGTDARKFLVKISDFLGDESKESRLEKDKKAKE